MELLKPTIVPFGPGLAHHNQPCAIYVDKPAVLQCNTGIFQPSWDAQKEGWRIVKATNWFQKKILDLFFNDLPERDQFNKKH